MINSQICFICVAPITKLSEKHYYKCKNCGHETIDLDYGQNFIINDILSIYNVNSVTLLDRYKNHTLAKFNTNLDNNILLDIGSGSGRFLFQNKSRFSKCYGIEISPEAVDFSSNTLGLNITNNISKISDNIDVATAWHSLEHIPQSDLLLILSKLSTLMKKDSRFIISVPNASSILYRLFNNLYAFYDFPNHIHQFTPKSLQILLENNNFEILEQIISWPYNIFGSIQSLLNIFNSKHNYLYYRFKRKSIKQDYILDIYNFLLLSFIAPLGLTLSLFNSIFSKYGSVLTICFIKK